MKRQKRCNSPFALFHQFVARHQYKWQKKINNWWEIGRTTMESLCHNWRWETKAPKITLAHFPFLRTPHPLNFSTWVNQPVRICPSEDSTAPTEICGTVFAKQSGTLLVVKHDHIREVSTNGPFFIGCVELDVNDNDENSYFDIQIYMLTFEDCLHLIYHKKCNVHRDAVISIADEMALQKRREFHNRVIWTIFKRTAPYRRPFAWRWSCDSNDKSDKEYTPVQTSSDRRVIPPNRLDL